MLEGHPRPAQRGKCQPRRHHPPARRLPQSSMSIPNPTLADIRLKDGPLPGLWMDGNFHWHFSAYEFNDSIGAPNTPESIEETIRLAVDAFTPFVGPIIVRREPPPTATPLS